MNHEHEYDLVVPLVVVDDNGGPYDSRSFVAGCEYATIADALRVADAIGDFAESVYTRAVRPDLMPQLDLLGMHQGWAVKEIPPPEGEPDDGWIVVRFEKLPKFTVEESA